MNVRQPSVSKSVPPMDSLSGKPETLAGTALRYPELDLTPWSAADSVP
jgi:hypothetical protein